MNLIRNLIVAASAMLICQTSFAAGPWVDYGSIVDDTSGTVVVYKGAGNPSTVYDEETGRYIMFFDYDDPDTMTLNCTGDYRNIGFATSTDGFNWSTSAVPAIQAAKTATDPHACGVEHPDIRIKESVTLPNGTTLIQVFFSAIQENNLCGTTTPTWGCEEYSGIFSAYIQVPASGTALGWGINPVLELDTDSEVHSIQSVMTSQDIQLMMFGQAGNMFSTEKFVNIPGFPPAILSAGPPTVNNPKSHLNGIAITCSEDGVVEGFNSFDNVDSVGAFVETGLSTAESIDYGDSWTQDTTFVGLTYSTNILDRYRGIDALKLNYSGDYALFVTEEDALGTRSIELQATQSVFDHGAVVDFQCENDESCYIGVAEMAKKEGTYAIKANGDLVSFGVNPTPDGEPAGTKFKSIEAGYKHWCGITDTDAIDCWHPISGTIPPGTIDDRVEGHPTTGTWTQLSTGREHNCALDDQGYIECWGSDYQSKVSGHPTSSGYKKVTAGRESSCAIDSNDDIECWGKNNELQAPAFVAGPFSDVTCGGFRFCIAINSTDGSLTSWGTPIIDTVITALPTDTGYVAVGSIQEFAYATKGDDSVTLWGYAAQGQISEFPTDVTSWTDLHANEKTMCGVVNNPGTSGFDQGFVTCWGLLWPVWPSYPAYHLEGFTGCLP